VTVAADGIVREITVSWGTSVSAWTYTVTYSSLGATAAPVAPANARPLRDRSHAGKPRTAPGGNKISRPNRVWANTFAES